VRGSSLSCSLGCTGRIGIGKEWSKRYKVRRQQAKLCPPGAEPICCQPVRQYQIMAHQNASAVLRFGSRQPEVLENFQQFFLLDGLADACETPLRTH